MRWAIEHAFELYFAVAVVVALATWANDLCYHPLPRLSRAFGAGFLWGMLLLVLALYPFHLVRRRYFPSMSEIDLGPRGLALNERAVRINQASTLWADTVRDACSESPERHAALHALYEATKAAMTALRRPSR